MRAIAAILAGFLVTFPARAAERLAGPVEAEVLRVVDGDTLVARARMSGLLVHDFADRFGEAVECLSGWLDTGELSCREHVLDGIEQAPGAIGMLYRGENNGKLVIRLKPE